MRTARGVWIEMTETCVEIEPRLAIEHNWWTMDYHDFETGEIMRFERRRWKFEGLKSWSMMIWNDDRCGTWNLQVLQNISLGKEIATSWCPIAKLVYWLSQVYGSYSICWMHLQEKKTGVQFLRGLAPPKPKFVSTVQVDRVWGGLSKFGTSCDQGNTCIWWCFRIVFSCSGQEEINLMRVKVCKQIKQPHVLTECLLGLVE